MDLNQTQKIPVWIAQVSFCYASAFKWWVGKRHTHGGYPIQLRRQIFDL